ncbi:MAG: DUF423 domain-containing protein [Acetobacteraceae bacterium]|nr:MAG: DUF423 domain-containing protein [Acetobacteraceae bacterium]
MLLFCGGVYAVAIGGVSLGSVAPLRPEPDGQQRLAMLASGLQQQGWHALALLAVGLWAERRGGVLPHLAGAAFAVGMLLFCGGVYAVAIGGVSLGSVAPVGGTLLMVGWALLFVSAVWRPRTTP